MSNTYLNTPFSEKDLVKSLGARWDGSRKQWYVPKGLDLSQFAPWLPAHELTLPPENAVDENAADLSLQGMALSQLMDRVSAAIFHALPDAIWVKAEISNQRSIKGEHLAIELVEHDALGNLTARVQAFLWKSQADRVLRKFKTATGGGLDAGIKVMLSVKTEFSATHGVRLIIQDIDPSYTLGDIEAKLRQIRDTLLKEGLIKRNQQLPCPVEFCRVAVISPEGAAGLGDFKRDADLLENAGLCTFKYCSARFQGTDAAQEICARLSSLTAHAGYDALCIIRGGGSVTDLYWLNDLDLARAVCTCPMPVFTGIGHERDNTVLDEIANRRFDTPSKVIGHICGAIVSNAQQASNDYQQILLSAQQQLTQVEKTNTALLNQIKTQALHQLGRAEHHVAELAADIKPVVLERLYETQMELEQAMQTIKTQSSATLSSMEIRLENYQVQIRTDAEQLLAQARQNTERLHQDIFHLGQWQLEHATEQVEALGREILGIGPKATLQRGFAIVRSEDGTPLVSAAKARQQATLNIEFKDGTLSANPINPQPEQS